MSWIVIGGDIQPTINHPRTSPKSANVINFGFEELPPSSSSSSLSFFPCDATCKLDAVVSLLVLLPPPPPVPPPPILLPKVPALLTIVPKGSRSVGDGGCFVTTPKGSRGAMPVPAAWWPLPLLPLPNVPTLPNDAPAALIPCPSLTQQTADSDNR